MRTLTLKSDTAEEDAAAASRINQEMIYGDAKKIVWHSTIGNTITGIQTQIESYKSKIECLEKKIVRLNETIKFYDKQMLNNAAALAQNTEILSQMDKTMEKIVALMKKIELFLGDKKATIPAVSSI